MPIGLVHHSDAFASRSRARAWPQDLEGLCSREGSRFRLPVTRDGILDALAMWFELHLDKETSLSTGPQEDTCWEQAIYPVQHLSGKSHAVSQRWESSP